MHVCVRTLYVLCTYIKYTRINTIEVFAKSLKKKKLRSKELLAESLAHSALEVTPCQKVLRIDKLQSVK